MECNFIKNPGKILRILEKLSSVSGQKKIVLGIISLLFRSRPKVLGSLKAGIMQYTQHALKLGQGSF